LLLGLKTMMDRMFSRWAGVISGWAGSPWGFTAAFAVILIWALLGPVLGFSNAWQLAVNTGTTIVTFLMVFVIQNSQNRDTRALQVKLDELIRATQGADNRLLDLETLSAAEIGELHARYSAIAVRAKELGIEFAGTADEPIPEVEVVPVNDLKIKPAAAKRSNGHRSRKAAAPRQRQ
jgi:low affinity Fe/Cu permease